MTLIVLTTSTTCQPWWPLFELDILSDDLDDLSDNLDDLSDLDYISDLDDLDPDLDGNNEDREGDDEQNGEDRVDVVQSVQKRICRVNKI